MDDTATRNEQGIARGASGSTTGDATVLTVTLGFRPQHVTIIDQTGPIRWEKIDGMLATQSLKTLAAGTTSLDTTSAIVITANGFTTSAALNASTHVLNWFAK